MKIEWTEGMQYPDGKDGPSLWIDGYQVEIDGDTVDEAEAIARLLAAAPDLLRELEAMVELFSGYQGMELQNAKAAITKARGA